VLSLTNVLWYSAIVFGVGLLAIWLFVSGPVFYTLNLVVFLHLFVVLMGYNARTIDPAKSKLPPSLGLAFAVAGSSGAVAMAVLLADGVSIGWRAAVFVYVLAFWAIVHRAAMAEVYRLLDTGNAE
jgi:hypothetical protein